MYFDNEAEEVESGDESEEEIKKSTKKSKNAISDNDDDDDDEEEEEENYEKTKEEFQNFIDDNEVEEESEHSNSKSSEKSSESENTELEEEDEQLLKENLNVDNLEKLGILKKRKRIKQTIESSEDEAEQPVEKPKKKVKSAKAKPRTEMDELADEIAQLDEEDEEADEEPMNEEDNENDFIVEDSDEENGEGGRRREPRKKHTYTDEAQQDALDIFGVNIEELGVYDSDAEAAEDEDEEYEDEEGDEGGMRESRKRQRPKAKLEDIFEPAELEKGLLTEADQQIRIEDKPERFMTRSTPITNEPNEAALDKEAEWIFRHAFDQKTAISMQEHQSKNGATTIPKIRDVLNFMRNEFLEVPFIAFYRKEYIDPDLDIHDLWRIYELDEKYCQLQRRKENLVKLLERMQKYQFDIIREHSELSLTSLNIDETTSARLIDMLRPLDEADIDRVRNANTNEEFTDAYMHFKLHYACDIDAMRARERESGSPQADDADVENNNEEEGGEPKGARVHRGASKKDRYNLCKLTGINSIAKKFGLTAEQFAENLVADYQRNEIDQWSVEPLSLAAEFVSEDRFVNAEQVLAAARYMVAMQLARDPVVKGYVRDVYMKRATITVRPTPKGVKEIDENHPCYSMKYLREKPVVSFRNEQYLKLALAEQDELVEVKFEVDSTNAISFAQNECSKMPPPEARPPDEDFDAPEPVIALPPARNAFFEAIATMPRQNLYERLKGFYQKDEFSYNVEQWNTQRALIVHELLHKILYPELEKELRSKMLAEAKEFVKKCCQNKMREWLQVAPYKTDTTQFDDNEQFESGFRLLAITFSVDIDAVAVCACVNPSGDLDEFIRLRKLTTRLGDGRPAPATSLAIDRAEKLEDFEKLKAFIIEKKPSVIAVAAENKESLMVIEDIKRLIDDIDKNTTKSDVKHMVNRIAIELVDNELAKVYSATKIAEMEFRDQSFLMKQAVALARQLQDPLLAYSQLCNIDNDIIALKYHTMQEQLSRDELLQALNIEFINIVNEVGVDVNRCVRSPHTANVLQFVSGLGPRKAANILKIAKSKMPVMNRMFLVSDCALGSRVFINCAGFIKLNVDDLAKEVDDEHDMNRYTDELDATRVHPEAYEWARKMAVDALDIEDTNDLAQVNSALKEIFENPERLKDLDLDAFADELERTGCGRKRITLYDIRGELYNRYHDPRRQYRPPGANEKFHMLTKETPQSFYTGKMVLCKVTNIARRRPTKEQLEHAEPIKDDNTCTWQCQFCKKTNFAELSQVWAHFDAGDCPGPPVGVRTMLDNQLNGFISLSNLSDKRVTNPDDRIKPGQTIYARIVKIDIDRFSVDLTCKTSDLRDVNHKWRPVRDEYYDEASENEDVRKMEERRRREEHKQTYTNRVIAHPQFHNIGYQQAVAMLASMNLGDAIIRPSSKGTNHLTVTWKVADGVYQHIDVLEEKKINEFSLGKRLIIDGEDFEDLDEILARHVSVMASYVQEILSHKNYRELDSANIDAVESALLNEQRENPNRIPYFFICDKNHPGRFLLSYIVKLKARHEVITITAEGFKFRNQLHKNFNALINWFKKNFNDPVSLRSSQASTSASSSQMTATQSFTQSQVPYPKDSFSQPSQRAQDSGSAPYTPSQATPYNQPSENSGNSPPRGRDRGFGGRGGGYNSRFSNNYNSGGGSGGKFRGNNDRGGYNNRGGNRGNYGSRNNNYGDDRGASGSGNGGGDSQSKDDDIWDDEPAPQRKEPEAPVAMSAPPPPPPPRPAPVSAPPPAASNDEEMWD